MSKRPSSFARSNEDPSLLSPELLRKGLLACAISLWASVPFLPSEAALTDGVFAPHAMLWMLLLLGYFGWKVWEQSQSPEKNADPLRFTAVELAGLGLIGWLVMSTCWQWGTGNTRASLHGIWLVISYGAGTWVTSRLIRSATEAKGLLLLLVGIAIALSVHGLYQYGVTFPAMRARFAADPQQICRESGINPDSSSTEYELFRNRIESKEPLATFSLTNSLAGLLAPSLVLLLAAILQQWKNLGLTRALGLLGFAAVVGLTLVLTKSRTGYLAVAMGLGLLAIGISPWGERFRWSLLLLVALGGFVLAVGAVAAGGLDVEVLSEAPKSLLYRLEYWQASGRMLLDHPLMGIGLGNFQANYSAYKLPQASEVIAEPHNVWVELATAGGIPAMILGLALAFAVLRGAFRLLQNSTLSDSSPAEESSGKMLASGALLGVLLGCVLAFLQGFPLSSPMQGGTVGLLLLGVPLSALAAFCLGAGPITAQKLSQQWGWGLLVALLVWGVNLLAAGAFVFPGVMLLFGLVVAVQNSSALRSDQPPAEKSAPALARLQNWGGLALAGLLVLLCVRSEYTPTLTARGLMSETLAQLSSQRGDAIERLLKETLAADPYHPEAHQLLAQLRLSQFVQNPSKQREEALEQAILDWNRVTAPSPNVYQQQVEWYQTLYRRQPTPEHLAKARAAANEVLRRFPAGAMGHVQAAWLADLAGDKEIARNLAQEALRLDELMPHQEQKLARKKVFDVGFRQGVPIPANAEGAEQVAKRLANPGTPASSN